MKCDETYGYRYLQKEHSLNCLYRHSKKAISCLIEKKWMFKLETLSEISSIYLQTKINSGQNLWEPCQWTSVLRKKPSNKWSYLFYFCYSKLKWRKHFYVSVWDTLERSKALNAILHYLLNLINYFSKYNLLKYRAWKELVCLISVLTGFNEKAFFCIWVETVGILILLNDPPKWNDCSVWR